jgi:hypothetical protein
VIIEMNLVGSCWKPSRNDYKHPLLKGKCALGPFLKYFGDLVSNTIALSFNKCHMVNEVQINTKV